MERTIKVVKISIPSVKGYSRWVYRVVECLASQNGYLNERGVKLLWESPDLYRPTTRSGRGKGPESLANAKKFAEEKLREVLGV